MNIGWQFFSWALGEEEEKLLLWFPRYYLNISVYIKYIWCLLILENMVFWSHSTLFLKKKLLVVQIQVKQGIWAYFKRSLINTPPKTKFSPRAVDLHQYDQILGRL